MSCVSEMSLYLPVIYANLQYINRFEEAFVSNGDKIVSYEYFSIISRYCHSLAFLSSRLDAYSFSVNKYKA